MEVNTICRFDSSHNICKSNQKFYSILRPTLFFLRFFGAPTGLYRIYQNRTKCSRRMSRIGALVMLVVINMGAIGDFMSTLNTVSNPRRQFDDNMNLFYALGLNITGALALDILWWRRRILRQMLHSIGSIELNFSSKQGSFD